MFPKIPFYIREKALTETDNAGLEVALEWLLITDGIESDKEEKRTQHDTGKKPLDTQFEEAAHHSVSQ